jgi:carbamoyltransferase
MSQLILGVHSGPHDAAAALFEDYELKSAISLERLSRYKSDGRTHPDLSIDEILSIAGVTRRDVDVVTYSRSLFPTRYYKGTGGNWLREAIDTYIKRKRRRPMLPDIFHHHTSDVSTFFDIAAYHRDSGFRDDAVAHFYNHHEAHALAPLFYSPWDEALLVTADGGGDTVHYSHRHFANGKLTTIYGGEEMILTPPVEDSLGKAYGAATKALGFRRIRHEGKVTGLAAMGKPVRADRIAARFWVDEAGRVHSNFRSHREINVFMRQIARGIAREDFAASIQQVLEDCMLLSIQRLLAAYPARHLGLAGGVFANVKLNRLLAEKLDLDEVFIFPPMGDDGLPAGGVLAYLLQRDGIARWLDNRRPLGNLYLGRDFSEKVDETLGQTPGIKEVDEGPVDGAARLLNEGAIGAVFTRGMEYGPRALGARSILANPARRETHDLLNTRLERSEFMPFAPVIAQERAAEVFDVTPVNLRACRYMTIACDVRAEWRSRIAAVVHVDGSARPQVIERADNPLYYDILQAFERLSGLPVLVNTSFNVHEEPIVNTPAECARALVDGRIDFVATDRGLYERA